jgi:hypothetical protein
MKTIALTLFAAALGFAQTSPNASTAPTTPVKPSASTTQKIAPPPQANKPQQKTTTQTQSIPDGAVQIEPNFYRYTDSNGKTWNYRRTPFGIAKWEETSAAAPPPTPAKSEPVLVTDLGDSYRFEKKTPFGTSTWVHKKTELTDDDKALLDHSDQPSPSVAQAPAAQIAIKTKEEK